MDLVLDPVGGLAGDMWLGLLVDLGADLDGIRNGLGSLGLADWAITAEATTRRAIGCTRVLVHAPEAMTHRHLPEIEARITASTLPPGAQATALGAFRLLADAEARVHRIPADQVHFHEVGAKDAILDICGAALGLHLLGVRRVWSSALPGGSGTVRCAHGELPVPVPAVVELVRDRFPLVLGVGEGEQVTPTGAAILAAVGAPWTPAAVTIRRVGHGAGSRAESVVRGMLVDPVGGDGDVIAVLETWIDDGHPEQLAWLVERLREDGALEVGTSARTTKHGRAGVALEVLARLGDEHRLVQRVFAESPTLGVRVRHEARVVLPRRVVQVETEWGAVRVKVAGQTRAPEYADCAAIARAHDVPLRRVYAAALAGLERG
ncbi:MAG: hypothetical protein ACI8PZ_000068 [Myxococcota bacterium]|jgi:uncharacterized protein (TIGR00299 family) protein